MERTRILATAGLCLFLLPTAVTGVPAGTTSGAPESRISAEHARQIALRKSPAPATVRFAVLGDYGRSGSAEQEVSNLVKSWGPDFIITVGDNNYPNGAASTIDQNIGQYYHEFISPYKGGYGEGATANRFFPSLGNHDWRTSGAQPYLDYFTLGGTERYYDVVRDPVHLFAIDSDPHEPDGNSSTSTQALWLQRHLATSTAPWKLVYFHNPPYSSGPHGSSIGMRWPFKAWGRPRC